VKRFALALLLIACDRREGAPPTADAAPARTVEAAAPSQGPLADAAPPPVVQPPVLATEGCGPGTPSPIRSVKSIGHTSVVFKIELESNEKMAWKPSSKRGKERWRGEIAAAKLGRALRIPNVPPACMRTFTMKELAPLLPKGALDEVIANEDGSINGAEIPWIEGLQFLPIEKEPLRTDWKHWLGDGGIPPEKGNLAAQLSTLVVFDAISGNWDRYSGANIGLDATGRWVLFIDNDAAFMEGAPPKELAANLARLEATQHFSRSLVGSLRTIDVARAFGRLPGGAPLLPEAIVKTVRERIANILKVIDAKIAAGSDGDVLSFL
jgi:hypothetical protein